MKQRLSLWQTPAVVAVLGLRWVATSAKAGASSLVLWLLAALLFFIPQGIAVITLASRFPEEGGVYAWTRRTYGEWNGFLCGWCYWVNNVLYYPNLLISTAVIGTYAIGKGGGSLGENWAYVLPVALAALWIAFSTAFLIVRIDGFGTPVTLGFGLSLAGLALRSRRWQRPNRLRIRADISSRRCVTTAFVSTAAIFIIGWWTRPGFPGAPVVTNLAVLIALLAAAGLTLSTTRNPAGSNELNSLALISGSVGYLALQGASVEIFGGLGMSLVGLTTIVLLVRSWRKNALRLGRSRSGTAEPEERQIQIVSVGG